MKNPFYFGNEVHDKEFCNRIDELRELKNDVGNGINVLLYAPRRFGKTSLLKKLQNELKSSIDTKVIFFDWMSVSSIDEFLDKYFHAIASNLESTSDKVMNLFKDMLQIRPSITMKISNSSDINYGLSFTKKELDSSFEDIINLPFQYAKKSGKKIVVIFDEFQEAEQFGIEKKLRTLIQTHSKDVSYIFSGSKKSILNAMFSDKNRAFYKSVKRLVIKEITLDDWVVFAKDKFEQTAKSIEKEHIKTIFEITNGFPYYTQQLLYHVWQECEQSVDELMIEESLHLMLEREYDLYAYIYSSLTPNQKTTLKYIALFDGKNLYSNDNLSEVNLSASTLKSTLESLMKKDICDRIDDRYYLVDPFMRYWLTESNG
ncbi:MAG: ATP-binding protein [Campylobacterales bacterium]|nr:ATP-binding protein [Campylobacterales bacterium]